MLHAQSMQHRAEAHTIQRTKAHQLCSSGLKPGVSAVGLLARVARCTLHVILHIVCCVLRAAYCRLHVACCVSATCLRLAGKCLLEVCEGCDRRARLRLIHQLRDTLVQRATGSMQPTTCAAQHAALQRTIANNMCSAPCHAATPCDTQ
jgi:hypothetical protein